MLLSRSVATKLLDGLIVSAMLVRALRAEIPGFFYAAEIAAAGMLLFFRKSATMDILNIRVGQENWCLSFGHE